MSVSGTLGKQLGLVRFNLDNQVADCRLDRSIEVYNWSTSLAFINTGSRSAANMND